MLMYIHSYRHTYIHILHTYIHVLHLRLNTHTALDSFTGKYYVKATGYDVEYGADTEMKLLEQSLSSNGS